MAIDTAPRTRTELDQASMCICDYCGSLFLPSKRKRVKKQRFCKDACRANDARENGMVGQLVGSRRLKTRISVTLYTTDDRILLASVGTRFRLVREP